MSSEDNITTANEPKGLSEGLNQSQVQKDENDLQDFDSSNLGNNERNSQEEESSAALKDETVLNETASVDVVGGRVEENLSKGQTISETDMNKGTSDGNKHTENHSDKSDADELSKEKQKDEINVPHNTNANGDVTKCVDSDEGRNSSHDDLGATAMAAGQSSQCSPGDSIYHIKWIYFKKKLVPIITQNENGPCPLLAILNVLLLQARVKIQPKTEVVTANQLMTYLGDCVLENVPSGSDEGMAASARLNFEQNMQDAVAVMYKLQTGIDVNVKFTGIKDFEYTPECIIFDLLQISLYHGWLVDPQNEEEVQAVGPCSYNQLVEKIICEKSSDQTETVSRALIAEQFLETSASQLTYHGLCELSSQLKEDELVVLFRNNHFITLYRHNNELFQLVTDQGLLHESNVVWETLSNVEGDCHFVDSEFRTYTKPEPVYNPAETSEPHLSPNEQIEQDFMVALSLQQEQQDQMAWAQVDPQQPPVLSDLELARSLQEEERRAAMAEQERNQQRQEVGAGAQHNTGNVGHRQPQRVDSREQKKSDCCIL